MSLSGRLSSNLRRPRHDLCLEPGEITSQNRIGIFCTARCLAAAVCNRVFCPDYHDRTFVRRLEYVFCSSLLIMAADTKYSVCVLLLRVTNNAIKTRTGYFVTSCVPALENRCTLLKVGPLLICLIL